MPRKRIDYVKIGREYAKHNNLKEAMESGGFSSTSALRGWDSMSQKGKEICTEASTKQVEKSNASAIKLSKKMDTEHLRHAARGHMIQNMGERSDKGIQTLKTIAQLAETSMLNPENMTGILIINAAPIPPFDSLPKWSEKLQRHVSIGDLDYNLRDRWCPKLGRTVTADGEFFRLPGEDEQALIRKHEGCDCDANPKFNVPALEAKN